MTIIPPTSIYPHSGTCGYCGRDRDDLFWHAQDQTFYCDDVFKCEARREILERRRAWEPCPVVCYHLRCLAYWEHHQEECGDDVTHAERMRPLMGGAVDEWLTEKALARRRAAERAILWNGEPYTIGAATGRDLAHVYLLRVNPAARDHPDFLRNLLVVPLNKAREAPLCPVDSVTS